jgi:hypothetical protein
MKLKMMPYGKMLAALILLAATPLAWGQMPSLRVMVQVRPAMLMTPAGGSTVQLAVRLAPSSYAAVWRADSCGAIPEGAQQVTHSGVLQIPVAQLGPGAQVCALSSDGALSQSLNLLPLSAQPGI